MPKPNGGSESLDSEQSVAKGVRASLPRSWEEISHLTERKAVRDGFGLTRCELEVLSKLVGGCPNKSIAADLAISRKDIRRHIANILNKLGVSNRLELVLFAIYHQLIDRPGFDGESH